MPGPLHGEILSGSDTVTLTVAPRPLSLESVTVFAPAGLSVSELIAIGEARVERSLHEQVVVYVEGIEVPRDFWPRVRVKTGSNVVLRATAGFGDGDNVLKSILSLAVVALALVLPIVVFPMGGLAAALLGAAISVGGTLLINTLFPVSPPQLNNESRSSTQSYSLAGGQNQADPFGIVPEVSGVMRVYPKLGAQWYTEFVGNDQYLRGLLVVGYGPKRISNIKIGETPITSFEDVQIEVREGYESDDPVTLYPSEVVQTDLSIDLTAAAGWQERRTATGVSELSVDFVAGSGIVRYDTNGKAQVYTVSLRAEYRLVGNTNWLLLGTTELSGRSRDAIRTGLRRVVPEGQYDVRVTKTSSDYVGEESVSESVVWSALRGFRNSEPLSFSKPLAVIAIRIRANSQLSGVVQTLNCEVSSPVTSWNGTSWAADTVSSNPADHFRHVLQGPANAKPKSDSRIDLTTLEEWAEYCTEQNFRFDFIHDAQRSVWDTLVMIATAGRAAVVFRDGKYSVVWDRPDSPIVQHFTPRNSSGFSGQRVYRYTPHAWRIRFVNSENAWQQDERLVYDDGYSASNASLFEAIEFPGQTVPANIWRHGRFHIAQAKLRPEIYSLNVDIEYLVCGKGDRVRVTHDVPMFGLSHGRVRSVSGSTVTLDEPVVMEALKNYSIRFRLVDGSSLNRNVQTDDGENFAIELTGTGSLPSAGDLFMFGETGVESVVLRVSGISPGADETARVSFVDDAPQISLADSGTIPDFQSNVSSPVNVREAVPVNLSVTEDIVLQSGTVVTVTTFSWETLAGQFPVSFDIEYRDRVSTLGWTTAGSVVAPTKYTRIYGLDSGIYDLRVRSVNSSGEPTGWATVSSVSLQGLSAVPGNVEGFEVQVIDDQSTLSWQAATGPVSYYTIRFSPLLVDATWGSSTVLQERVDATSVQVPTLVGTFFIKAITAAGVESTTATAIVSDVAGLRELNVVELWVGEPDWTGDATNVVVNNDSLRLLEYGGVLDWPPVLEITSLFWTTQFPYEYGYLDSDQIIDLGEIFTSRVSARIDAFGDSISNVIGGWGPIGGIGSIGGLNADQWSVRIFESHSNLSPLATDPEWSPYAELSMRDISARSFRFQVRLYSLVPGITPVVSSAQVTIDMPDRVIAGENISSLSSGELSVDFEPPFRQFEGMSILAQDMQTGDYYETYNKDETGFQIEFFNAAGTSIVRTFDYVAKGYGKRVV